jgi:hypothetical protein
MGLTVKLLIDGDAELLAKVNQTMVRAIEEAAQTMVEKNVMRGDGWRLVGLIGAFIELHTCYARLRGLLWDRTPAMDDPKWRAEVANVLKDQRNYTIIGEMNLEERSLYGSTTLGELGLPKWRQ